MYHIHSRWQIFKSQYKNSGFQYEGTGEKKAVVRAKIDDIYTAGRKEGD